MANASYIEATNDYLNSLYRAAGFEDFLRSNAIFSGLLVFSNDISTTFGEGKECSVTKEARSCLEDPDENEEFRCDKYLIIDCFNVAHCSSLYIDNCRFVFWDKERTNSGCKNFSWEFCAILTNIWICSVKIEAREESRADKGENKDVHIGRREGV